MKCPNVLRVVCATLRRGPLVHHNHFRSTTEACHISPMTSAMTTAFFLWNCAGPRYPSPWQPVSSPPFPSSSQPALGRPASVPHGSSKALTALVGPKKPTESAPQPSKAFGPRTASGLKPRVLVGRSVGRSASNR